MGRGTRDWRSCGSKRNFRNFHSVQDGGGLGNNGPDSVQDRNAVRPALNGRSRNWNHSCPAPRPPRKLPEGMLDLRPSVISEIWDIQVLHPRTTANSHHVILL